MQKTFLKNNIARQKGYTLLFAVLVTSIVLSVSLSILNISRKESLLSGAARESQAAIYAADSGIECAVLQAKNGTFVTPAFTGTESPSQYTFTCGQSTVTSGAYSDTVDQTHPDDGSGLSLFPPANVYNFNLNLSTTNNGVTETACANVQVTRRYIYQPSISSDIPQTVVESRGYNTGWDDATHTCVGASPKKVERAIRFSI